MALQYVDTANIGGNRLFRSLVISTERQVVFMDVTKAIKDAVHASGVQQGVCILYVPHTTAGLTINENADPDVIHDLARSLERIVPTAGGYAHREGNADAHIKASLMGCSANLIIKNSQLLLGAWQGIFFCEFDGPRERHLHMQIMQDASLLPSNSV